MPSLPMLHRLALLPSSRALLSSSTIWNAESAQEFSEEESEQQSPQLRSCVLLMRKKGTIPRQRNGKNNNRRNEELSAITCLKNTAHELLRSSKSASHSLLSTFKSRKLWLLHTKPRVYWAG